MAMALAISPWQIRAPDYDLKLGAFLDIPFGRHTVENHVTQADVPRRGLFNLTGEDAEPRIVLRDFVRQHGLQLAAAWRI